LNLTGELFCAPLRRLRIDVFISIRNLSADDADDAASSR
jgi:hypothetical protein